MAVATRPVPHGWSGIGALAREAETLGVDRIWFTDHLFWHRAAPDALVAAGVAAAATSSIGVGTLVLQLPLRPTAAVAKATSFVDEVSGGRMVVGVGVGEHRWEYDLAGAGDRFPRRGRLLDEAITDLRRHWTAGDEPPMGPVRDLPVWIGGRSDAARRRAARLGDGWIPHLCPLDWFRDQIGRYAQDREASGRPGEAAVTLMVHVDEIEPSGDPSGWASQLYGLPPKAFERAILRGSAARIADSIGRYLEAGASHVALFPASDRQLDHVGAVIGSLGR